MNRKFNPIIAVGAVLLLVGVVVLAILAGRGGSSTPSKVKALVAQSDVAAGTPAASADLRVQEVSSKDVPSGSPGDLSSLAGKFATTRILKGQVITTSSFQKPGQVTTTGVSLPKAKQALGMELGFAPGGLRYVVPGNKINVYAVPKQKADNTGTVHLTPGQVVLRDVLVLQTTPGVGDGSGTAPTPGAGNLDFLLAVDETQARVLVGAAATADVNVLYFTLSSAS
jgi:Flp pilus assembly protein CpaB